MRTFTRLPGPPRLALVSPRRVWVQRVELRGDTADGGARSGTRPLHPGHLGPDPGRPPRP